MHILLVDDDDDIREAFSTAFTMLGHQVMRAAGGVEALGLIAQHQRLEHQSFDAVLLDVEMPTMSGWNVLQAIRDIPAGERLPVVLFTAHGNVSSEAYAKMLGAYALLGKPCSADAVLEVIKRAIAEQQAHDAALRSSGDAPHA